MKILGNSSLETVDLGTALEFRLTPEAGLLDSVAGPIIVAIFFGVVWNRGSVVYGVMASLGLIGLIVIWVRGGNTILRVSETSVIARGNLESWLTSELAFDVSDISSMGWSAGGEGDNGGLYVSSGLMRPWVLPGVTEKQAQTVLNAISQRFPHFPLADHGAGSALFGNDSGIITLKLSEPTPPREK